MTELSQQQMQKTIYKAIKEQSEPNRVVPAFHSLLTALLTFAICSMAGTVYAATLSLTSLTNL